MIFGILKIDHKLIAVQLRSFHMFNITDNLVGHTIRKITFDHKRIVILTTTNLYYLCVEEEKFKLVDITPSVTPKVNICDIKFVTGSHNQCNNIGIFTNLGEVFIYNFGYVNKKTIEYLLQLENKDVIAVSNEDMGYIYRDDNKYVVEYIGYSKEVNTVCTLDEMPSLFISPKRFMYGTSILNYREGIATKPIIEQENVSHIYNEHYYGKDGSIYCMWDISSESVDVFSNIIDNYTMINCISSSKIVSIDNNKTKIVKHVDTNMMQQQIAISYYYVENLHQYSNDTWNAGWIVTNYHLYDKYSDKLVRLILLCYKYSNLRQWIPKGVMLLILQFAL